jgi:hypothetical protein
MEWLGGQVLLGALAAFVSFIAGFVYIVDILRGRAKPHRVTWWVLGLLNCAIAASYYASGATTTILLPLEFGISFLIIGVLSIKLGEGQWQSVDSYCIVGAIAGIALWWFTRSAPFALGVFVAIDLLALIPTMIKAYLRPWTEDSSAWLLGAIAAFLNVLAINAWSLQVSLYPLYVFLTSGLICYWTAGFRKRSADHVVSAK